MQASAFAEPTGGKSDCKYRIRRSRDKQVDQVAPRPRLCGRGRARGDFFFQRRQHRTVTNCGDNEAIQLTGMITVQL